MADHVNIQDPESMERNWRHLEEVQILSTKLTVANQRILHLEGELSAIFTRIGRGDPVELHYRDGSMIRVVAIETDE